MNPSEYIRKLEKLNDSEIRRIGIESVQVNSDIVIKDSIDANLEGFTFASNRMDGYFPFSDWEETGEFHDNLRFENTNDIGFTSIGKGAESIFSTFPEKDTEAPTAKILSGEAIDKIRSSFIKNMAL